MSIKKMKCRITLLLILFIGGSANQLLAQSEIQFRFRKDHTFKIAQFTGFIPFLMMVRSCLSTEKKWSITTDRTVPAAPKASLAWIKGIMISACFTLRIIWGMNWKWVSPVFRFVNVKSRMNFYLSGNEIIADFL